MKSVSFGLTPLRKPNKNDFIRATSENRNQNVVTKLSKDTITNIHMILNNYEVCRARPPYFIQLSKLLHVLLPLWMNAALERALYGAGNRLESNSKPESTHQRTESQRGVIEKVLDVYHGIGSGCMCVKSRPSE